jgi:hypothetical protein
MGRKKKKWGMLSLNQIRNDYPPAISKTVTSEPKEKQSSGLAGLARIRRQFSGNNEKSTNNDKPGEEKPD